MSTAPTTTAPPPPFILPWPCLLNEDVPKPKTPPTVLPQPCMKGDRLAIEIPEDEYIAGFDECKFNLHGRIIWPKGSNPVTVDSLRNRLSMLWKSIGKWGITSIGKGYYEFTFSSLEDMKRVRTVGSWSLNPGILKLFAWSRDFSPNTQQQTTTQVWLRIYGLSQEYWRKKILFAITSSVGTPICTDAITSKPRIERSFGHFARVLVDIDLSQELRYRVLVERKGHSIDICKRLKDNKGKQTMAQPVKPRQEFVPKTKAAEVNQVATRSERSKEDVDLENEINDELAQDEIVPIVHDVDQNIEKEGNESAAFVAVEDNSTDGSEFVEATQQNFEDDSVTPTFV
ncbi:DUF4283 domain protein [Medicago truncatula]|uniref:DUF4283 domain protein n=1 Tax=Medicago truncatula TaxID=3880 RepID=G7JRE6_MEDTR|nr:DUF4283 domain protein [Medicago truncatula]